MVDCCALAAAFSRACAASVKPVNRNIPKRLNRTVRTKILLLPVFRSPDFPSTGPPELPEGYDAAQLLPLRVAEVLMKLVIKNLLLSKLFGVPTPPWALLLQTKGKVQFDRAVTERSKPLFRVQSPSNPYQIFWIIRLPILLFG